VRLRVHESVDEIPEAAWDALLDERATPFVRWAWLEALEHGGCAVTGAGWRPRHLALWRGERLVAAAPAYLKQGSDGDFSRDWGWAEAAHRAGIPYYPKLIACVPFTPVTGRRVLVAASEERAACVRAIVDGARAVAGDAGARSVHFLFPLADEADELERAGMARRVSFQYHWRNAGYRAPDEFLARFNAKRRHAMRRERAAPPSQGIAIRTVRGGEIAAEARAWAERAFALHRSTVEKLMWGRGCLTEAFYRRVFERMPGPLEVVAAERDGKLVAGAFNLASPTTLWGRYWGCLEEHPFLHFNVCLYHSIDDCIARGLEAFEGGAGGEHKIARGFEPAETYSAHAFLDPRLDRPLRTWIARECEERTAALARWHAASPLFKR
jgi:predicted N-acyltransferase